jgi:hypothetical protein
VAVEDARVRRDEPVVVPIPIFPFESIVNRSLPPADGASNIPNLPFVACESDQVDEPTLSVLIHPSKKRDDDAPKL